MSSAPAAILSRFPGPVVLVPSRRKWLFVLGGSLAFVAIGLWVRHDDPLWGWLGVGFFGIAALVGALMLLPGAGGLRLDSDGFEMTNLFRRHRCRWTEVSEFEVVRLPPSRQKMVVFDDARTEGHCAGEGQQEPCRPQRRPVRQLQPEPRGPRGHHE